MQLSYWEKTSFLSYDYLIIGAGITGLSLGIELAETFPKAKIAILERGILPSGASTKNAGFACIGSLSEKVHDRKLMGDDAFLTLIQDRVEGLQILRNRLGDHTIDFKKHGGFELLFDRQNMDFLQEMEAINQLLQPLLGNEIFSIDSTANKAFGFNPKNIKTIVKNHCEGQLDTGKMMQALQALCTSKGVQVFTNTNVNSIDEENLKVLVNCDQITFKAQQVFLCTNAFTKRFLPEEDLQPGRGQVLVTKPISNLKVKGIFSFDEGYYYFRNIHERIIFGGGRNLDFEGETTIEFGSNQNILNKLNQHLQETILHQTPFEIDYQWSGIMAFGGNKQPLVKKVSERIFVGARLNGMGVAIGSKVAKNLLTLLLQHS
jgi:glycine/D-amino acid oxidase-like deaminating enzyme